MYIWIMDASLNYIRTRLPIILISSADNVSSTATAQHIVRFICFRFRSDDAKIFFYLIVFFLAFVVVVRCYNCFQPAKKRTCTNFIFIHNANQTLIFVNWMELMFQTFFQFTTNFLYPSCQVKHRYRMLFGINHIII